ncbi:MAG: hypothetical protein U0231_18140 [Nitrospiraceae bacterium]
MTERASTNSSAPEVFLLSQFQLHPGCSGCRFDRRAELQVPTVCALNLPHHRGLDLADRGMIGRAVSQAGQDFLPSCRFLYEVAKCRFLLGADSCSSSEASR